VESPPSRSATSARLIDLLAPHTPFAEAIVRRQAERAGLSLTLLGEADLPTVGPMIIQAAGLFLDPEVLAQLRAALRLR
jgi:hypothetical protein